MFKRTLVILSSTAYLEHLAIFFSQQYFFFTVDGYKKPLFKVCAQSLLV